jgi:hypothetical protein
MSASFAWRRALAAAASLVFIAACSADRSRQTTSSPTAAATPPAAPATPSPPEGKDFGDDARLLYRVLACAGDETLPPALDVATLEAHCAQLAPRMQRYRDRYLKVAAPFLAELRPKELPATVVYPFGGGDLLSALTTYPDAREITTLSLELSGDPRRLRGLDPQRLRDSLDLIRRTIGPLLAQNDSTSENLMKGQQNDIPGQVGFFVVALAVHGFEPVAMRYFRIEPDGRLHYLSAAEIDAGDDTQARSLKGSWTPPDFAPVFANVEIAFRERGLAGAALRVHRHIGANLADGPLKKDPSVLRYLESRGRVAAMTKAASYLLWRPDFSLVRRYLLDHMAFMVSDSTGIPPRLAEKAGFEQETYGTFAGSFLGADSGVNQQFRALWRSQPKRKLPFRYGYLDSALTFHMLVTRPARDARVASSR